MERRPFGPARFSVPVIGEGTWRMESDDRQACIDSLRAGLDAGLTHLDTAELYGFGVVEREIVRPVVAGRRDEVFLVSKVHPRNADYQGTLAACEKSLDRIGTDRLDCYLLHWPGPHPLAETIRAFEELEAAGKIRSWGVSNFDVPDLEKALAIAGPGRIACNQVLYHLEDRTIEAEVIPWCEENGVSVTAYSPFGAGDFPDPGSPGGRVLEEVARAHGTTPRQVALRFLVRRPSVFTIPKTANRAHAIENAAAGDQGLTPEEIARIDAAFPAAEAGELSSL